MKHLITQKIKMGNMIFFIRFITLGIFHVNGSNSDEEGGGSAYPYLGQGLVHLIKKRKSLYCMNMVNST